MAYVLHLDLDDLVGQARAGTKVFIQNYIRSEYSGGILTGLESVIEVAYRDELEGLIHAGRITVERTPAMLDTGQVREAVLERAERAVEALRAKLWTEGQLAVRRGILAEPGLRDDLRTTGMGQNLWKIERSADTDKPHAWRFELLGK